MPLQLRGGRRQRRERGDDGRQLADVVQVEAHAVEAAAAGDDEIGAVAHDVRAERHQQVPQLVAGLVGVRAASRAPGPGPR